ncbi:Cyclic nucleotide-gated potassium channel [Novipirellula aureliae]|uniref:Cyclic nucleotide-gated potassium channel n=1 Tax=Novipirellula aureliae TaxID=2527966 RepID=A0A5C6DL90_9BACT|nr:ion transporter [Novipirellula aureliae]TWU35686.1 Cyclic nucleotide-gated potassium channel [Novipirellula aureliae]
MSQRPLSSPWRQQMYDVIFEAETPAGRWFDIGLLVAILASIFFVSLETVEGFKRNQQPAIYYAEWGLTVLFSIEYVLRLICSRHPLRYAFSFWGVIDLLSVVPGYLEIVIGNSSRSLMTLRSIRLLRVFRVMKLWRMMNEADELSTAIWRARNKIVVFLAVILVAVTISGSLMYHVETLTFNVDPDTGVTPDTQFTSIPQAMYWATVTMTTVGYGDVVPRTVIGKFISAALILLGYSLIIVPTGFVSAEIVGAKVNGLKSRRICQTCETSDHPDEARYCYRCGTPLGEFEESEAVNEG